MKVAVLMSGGVDSTVSAILLKEQGHEVLGLTMINWDESVGRRAAETARKLGIKHRIINLQAFFQERVIDYFCRSYEAGLTPNPCVECNKYVKFGVLLDKAFEIGCDKVATGHYARIEYDAGRNRYLLKKGMDTQKDQSYFLYGLKQDQLAHILFPLGEYQKKQVKDLARQRGLEAADAKESQEICFISGDYRDFIRERTSLPED
jgi:tRNA-specific 2-thiouridylase